ncbi:hypothetical protein [Phyllobacterium zundukense]|jgi:hypothetical protein|uniref:Uncharacterized protein n=1 Tax=Phyllobacterium zundukense TaxID=1867719 RepID=A0ACD4D9B5_9HYPH|nr:hypothetical protein [Phyllobacterium zundukense]UXN62526.1 hypothetical protein N8E88_21405 [Phyllobacterium zundukense]
MGRKNDYLDDELLQPSALSGAAGGILRITLLFGSAAVALALIIAPLADRGSQAVVDYSTSRSIDEIQTGSIKTPDPITTSTYTIRRSILQSSPKAVCILNSDGSKIGDC